MTPAGYVNELEEAGLNVVVDRVWTERGTSIGRAADVHVEHTGDTEDGSDVIDAHRDSGAHAFIRRDGSVWVLGGAKRAHGDTPATLHVVLAAAEKGKGKPTVAQADTLSVLLSVLPSVATGAALPDEPEADAATEGPEDGESDGSGIPAPGRMLSGGLDGETKETDLGPSEYAPTTPDS